MRPTFNGIMGTAQLDFGNDAETELAVVMVSADQVRSYSTVTLTLAGPTVDHDIEDGLLEQLVLAHELVPGIGFNIYAHAPNGTWGIYDVQYLCTYF